MASVLHGSARTTACLRADFQASEERTLSLATRYGPLTLPGGLNRAATPLYSGPRTGLGTIRPLPHLRRFEARTANPSKPRFARIS